MKNIKIYNATKGSFISGRKEYYMSKDCQFIVEYRLNDKWSRN